MTLCVISSPNLIVSVEKRKTEKPIVQFYLFFILCFLLNCAMVQAKTERAQDALVAVHAVQRGEAVQLAMALKVEVCCVIFATLMRKKP